MKNQLEFDGTGYVKNADNKSAEDTTSHYQRHDQEKSTGHSKKNEAETVKIINEMNFDNKTKRKPSLFPTLENLPDTRPKVGIHGPSFLVLDRFSGPKSKKDKYKRKQSVADFTKNIYNMERSNVISKGAIPLSQRRLSQVTLKF